MSAALVYSWCATQSAIEGFILARTGEVPQSSRDAAETLARLHWTDESLMPLRVNFAHRISDLLDGYIDHGSVHPMAYMNGYVATTPVFVGLAEQLALGDDHA